MDGLDEFEKELAAEKAEREQNERKEEERRNKKHRHHHSSRRSGEKSERHTHRDHEGHKERRHRSDQYDDELRSHRHKRPRRDTDNDGDLKSSKDVRNTDKYEHEKRHHGSSSASRREREGRDDTDTQKSNQLTRDAWMTAPSALDVDYVHRPEKSIDLPPPKQEPIRVFHKRELNSGLQDLPEEVGRFEDAKPLDRKADYEFGDAGSNWRMTKLKALYTAAEQSGRQVEDVALERYGTLQDFDDAREEQLELDRRKRYGEGYIGKSKPTGEFYKERQLASLGQEKAASNTKKEVDQEKEIDQSLNFSTVTILDQTALNRLRAKMMKAKLCRAPEAAQLEKEYNAAMANFKSNPSEAVVLGVMDARMMAGTRGEVKSVDTRRGREQGKLEENDTMTLDDMVREERRTRGQAGGEGLRLAERIAKDAKFDNDLEYMDENAEKLAKRVHKSDINMKNVAVNEYQKLTRILDKCPLCHHDDKQQAPIAPMIALGTRTYLTLPTEPEVGENGAVIVPISHRTNLLECDDDEWEEIRNFMKSLTRMYHDQGRDVVFYENAAAPQRHPHAAMVAVAIPYEDGAMAPAYFKEAFLSADEEWSQHKKVIDTGAKAQAGMGRMAFRRSIAKEMPYFHAWFTLDGGLGHIVENSDRWPRGDLFAREVLGGILDTPPDVIKRQGRWSRSDPRVEGFKKLWRKFDWTRVLVEGQ
jgi:hypothetical protein